MESIIVEGGIVTGHSTDEVNFGEAAFEWSEEDSMPEVIYKYLSLNEYTLKKLIRHQLYFQQAKEYNDPFDGGISLSLFGSDKQWEQLITEILIEVNPTLDVETMKSNKKKEILDYYNKNRKSVLDLLRDGAQKMFGVSCFTEVEPAKGMLMFSHYSNSHKGICLEFFTKKEGVGHLLFHGLRKVQYSTDFPDVSIADIQLGSALATIIHTKSKYWEYESEWRAVLIESGRSFNYPTNLLKGITLGVRATKEDEYVIRRILKGLKVELKKAHLASNKFEIEIEVLPPIN